MAFLFDMDGTIVDNMSFHVQAWREFFAGKGVDLDDDELWDLVDGKASPEIIRSVLGDQLPDEHVKDDAEQKDRIYRDLYRSHLQPIAGLERFLKEARRRGVSVALATSAGQENIKLVVDGLEIRSLFSTITGFDEVQRSKPSPDLFLTAARKLGVDPETCLVFEDALAGVEAAGRARMHAVAITTSHAASEFTHPSVVRIVSDYTSLDVASLQEWAV